VRAEMRNEKKKDGTIAAGPHRGRSRPFDVPHHTIHSGNR